MISNRFRESLASVEVNDTFTEAVVGMTDGSRLCFRHSVGEQIANVFCPGATEETPAAARELLAAISRFRLNAKHLEVQFSDGSRWEAAF